MRAIETRFVGGYESRTLKVVFDKAGLFWDDGKMKRKRADLIALTGGPGAGKTTVLELIAPIVSEKVAILPEAAGIVFGGGFWRMESIQAKKAAQRAIFHVQKEFESMVVEEGRWSAALCDRGTLDGLAYWPGKEREFWETFQTNLEQEFSRYRAVIHLRSPGLRNGYNHQNPLRVETPEEAAAIDERICNIWKRHPGYVSVDSEDSFQEKVDKALSLICALLEEGAEPLTVQDGDVKKI